MLRSICRLSFFWHLLAGDPKHYDGQSEANLQQQLYGTRRAGDLGYE
jgi:hypothetical protein